MKEEIEKILQSVIYDNDNWYETRTGEYALDTDTAIPLMAEGIANFISSKMPVMLSLPSDEELAAEVVVKFLSRNPHPKSKIYLEWEKKAFINGAKWMQEEIEKRNKLGNGA